MKPMDWIWVRVRVRVMCDNGGTLRHPKTTRWIDFILNIPTGGKIGKISVTPTYERPSLSTDMADQTIYLGKEGIKHTIGNVKHQFY